MNGKHTKKVSPTERYVNFSVKKEWQQGYCTIFNFELIKCRSLTFEEKFSFILFILIKNNICLKWYIIIFYVFLK
jgi:hypothetical protein